MTRTREENADDAAHEAAHPDRTFHVTLEVTVHDEDALYEAAVAHAKRDGMSDEQIEEFGLRNEDGEVHAGNCLQMILDPGESPPGCQLEYSEVEDVTP